MNRHMREEHEKMNRGRHKEFKETKKHKLKEGGRLIGEKSHKSSGYEDGDWGKVHAMLTGKHPTTNICTNKILGKESEKKKYAAGGVGKIRHQAYD